MSQHLTWLHLSDLHACDPNTGWDAKRVTDTLLADLKRMQKDHGLRPDLIFFTGDAAFGHLGNERGGAHRKCGDYSAKGKSELFSLLRPFLQGGDSDTSYDEIAATLSMSTGAVKVAVHRLRQRYRDMVHREIAQTVSSEDEIEDELSQLLAALRA